MPSVTFAPRALRDLARLRAFLQPKNPAAGQRAAVAIVKSIKLLTDQPLMGRPVPEMEPAYRELPIDFGDSGYLALYRVDGNDVIVLTLRHQKEAGYPSA